MISNEQRAHEFALLATKLVFENPDSFTDLDEKQSLTQLYLNTYEDTLQKIKESK